MRIANLKPHLPIPHNEESRLAALIHYEILDTLPEKQFDELTRLAADICGVPIALVSLIDNERQWFKSAVGLDAKETPREISFCQYAIMGNEIFEVDNALEDDRFASNPLVTDDPNIRFYAGAPLIDDSGYALGTLCVIDSIPKSLSKEQKRSLRTISNIVVQLIQYRKQSIEEQKYRQFFNMSKDCLSIANTKGYMEVINPGFEQLLGYSIDELNANAWQDFIHPHDIELMTSAINSLNSNNTTVSMISRFKVKNGGWKWLSWLCTLQPSTGMIYSVARDETELIETDTRLQNELKAINNAVIRIEYDIAGNIIEVNDRCLKVLNYERDQLLQENYHTLYLDSPFNQYDFKTFWGETISTEVRKDEFLFQDKDGNPVWLKGALIPVRNIEDKVVRVIQLAYNVTSEKRISKELLSLSNFQEEILNGTSHAIISTGVDGTIRLWNKGASELLGYSAEEVIDIATPEFIHDKDELVARAEVLTEELGAHVVPGFETLVVKARQFHISDENEWTYLHKDGTRIPVWVSVTALRDEHGAEEGYLCIAVDSSKIKRMEKSLKQAKDQAEESLKAKEVFLANMSHEIRTPLNAIIGFTNLLKEKALDGDTSDYISAVAVASQNLLGLINDVLDISKIDQNKIALEQRILNLKVLTENLSRLNSQLAIAKGISLDVCLDSRLPDFVLADELRISQILTNLLNNAIKFTSSGGVVLAIRVEEMHPQEVSLTFSVKDTGIGIPDHKIEAIFNRFVQAENSTTREYGGSGLGLNIVKKLVNLLGGEIKVQSEPGVGSEFWFTISLPIPSEDQLKKEQMVTHPSRLVSLEGVSVLLAEDNEHNQILAATYIERNNGKVDVAQDGEIAIQKIEKNAYDIILMDLHMPKMDGFQATEIIRQKMNLDIPIVACTANSLVDEKKKSLTIGMNDYITKPYTENTLVQTIYKYAVNAKDRQMAARDSIQVNSNSTSEQKTTSSLKDNIDQLLAEMESKEGLEFTNAMVQLLIKRLPNDVAELEEGLLHNNKELLIQKSHLLAGSLASFQFTIGTQLAKKAELSAKEGRASFWNESQKLVDYLKELRNDLNNRHHKAC